MGVGGATDGGGSPPPADIGDLTYSGQVAGANLTKVLSVGVAIPAGRLIRPALVTRSGVTSVSVSDSKGNTYGATVLKSGGSAGKLWLCEALATTALTTSDTVTFTTNDASYAVGRVDFCADTVTSSFFDEDIGPFTSTSATGSFSQAGPNPYAQANQEVIEYLWAWDALASVTPTSGFSALTVAVSTADDYRIHVHRKKISATTQITHNPSWTAGASSQNVALVCQSIKGAV